MSNFEIIVGLFYILCVIWNMGYQLRRASSLFFEDDYIFWAVAITSSLLGFFTTALILGANYSHE